MVTSVAHNHQNGQVQFSVRIGGPQLISNQSVKAFNLIIDKIN